MIDFRSATFNAFVSFVFDHPAYEGQDLEVDGDRVVRVIEERPRHWYWDVDWEWNCLPSDPGHVLALLTHLFTHAGALRGRFSPRQISQGFQLLLGSAAPGLFIGPIWSDQLPWGAREKLVRATLPLYDDLFDRDVEIDYLPFMYWDLLLDHRYLDPRNAGPEAQDAARMRVVAADVIRSMILDLNGAWSAPAGLHGAHHVNHPVAFAAVRKWLEDPGNSDEHYREYAQQVLDGVAI